MPVYEVTAPNGKIFELEGDSPPTEQELEEIFASMVDDGEQEEQGFMSAAADTGKFLGQAAASEVGAGLSGLATGAFNQSATTGLLSKLGIDPLDTNAAQAVEEFRLANAPSAPTGRSAEQLQDIGGAVETVTNAVNVPISGAAGLAELATGQGLDQAAQTVQDVQEDGISEVLGERALEETGNPLAATIAFSTPTAILEGFGLKGALATRGVRGKALEKASQVASKQSKAKQKIGAIIDSGSVDKVTAKWELKPGKLAAKTSEPLETAAEKTAEALRVGAPKIQKDKIAREALKQGFDEGIVAVVKGGSPEDKAKMLKMVEKMKAGKSNAKDAAINRPSDIAGDSLVSRFKHVVDTNKQAGKQLDVEARKLKGQKVDFGGDVDGFIDDLQDIGVTLDDNFTPNFTGSVIEGSEGAEKAVNRVIKRMKNTVQNPDAFDLHNLKKFIDEQVSFGKQSEGLTGKTENILKNLRRRVDNTLDSNFPDYDNVNTIYAETINTIDNLQDAAGKKLDLKGANADKATGTVLRRLMSNTQSRVNLLDSIDEIDMVAKRYGGQFDDDILSQVLFADELDRVFSPVARTSFQGQIKQGVESASRGSRGMTEIAIDKAGDIAEQARGINEANAFKSIEELLRK